MFNTEQEINQKLQNCVIVYQDKPFYVHQAASSSAISGIFCNEALKTENLKRVSLKDKELDFQNIGERLGYVNLSKIGGKSFGESLYVMRQPVRRSHQGLHDSNMFVSETRSDYGREYVGRVLWKTIHKENAVRLAETFLNQYPGLSEINKLMTRDDGVYSRAFDRNWCIERDTTKLGPEFNIMYKMQKVGYSEDLNTFKISNRYKLIERDFRLVTDKQLKRG